MGFRYSKITWQVFTKFRIINFIYMLCNFLKERKKILVKIVPRRPGANFFICDWTLKLYYYKWL